MWFGHPRSDLRCGDAEVEVGTERSGDLASDEFVERRPTAPVHQFPEDETERQHVVAAHLPWLVHGLGRLQYLDDLLPVVKHVGWHGTAEPDEARAVAEHLPWGDALLLALGELWPVVGDRCVDVEDSPVPEHEHRDRDRDLGRREGVDEGVALPRLRTSRVEVTTPQVHDELAVPGRREGAADVEAGVEIGSEGSRRGVNGSAHTPCTSATSVPPDAA